jgi:hypothetical protein
MKYLEELVPGDCFENKGIYYVLSSDFKSDGSRLCLSLQNGFIKWIKSNEIVNLSDLFTLDKENNIIAIKKRDKDANIENQNIH